KGQVDISNATLDRELANQANAQAKADRAAALFAKGYVAGSSSDDAQTALDVQKKNVAIARAQQGAAQQSLKSANAQLEVAKQNLQVTRRKGTADIASSQAKRDQAASSLKVAKVNSAQNPAYRENLAALAASVASARSQLDQAISQRGDTQVRSSIDGYVTARNGDVGSLASPGTPVLTVESTEWLFFNCSLPVDEAPQVRVGMEVKLHLDSVPDAAISGVVSNINPSADNASRQFTVLIKVQNADGTLRPGMFGQADLVTQKVDAAIAVPREAIRPNAKGKSQVAVVQADSTVKLVDVVIDVQ
ncbi:MAG: efflux RND transporter periplasmic adaptor subunit, partial [Armatimonadota bacterium]